MSMGHLIWQENLEWAHSPAEKDDIIDLLQAYPSLKKALKIDYTPHFIEELKYKLYGKIPRNWVVNIQGLIGTPTGVFKSALGLNIIRAVTPEFNASMVKKCVAFTPYQLSRLVRQNAKRKQVFMLDEYIHDLKLASVYQLQNIVEQCREIQLSFVFCGVPKETYTFSNYVLERLDESDDKYLPKKRVRYLVRKPDTDRFRGYIVWDIPPLKEDKEWTAIWKEYMKLKTRHQQSVTEGKITGFDFEDASKVFINKINDYIEINSKGNPRILKSILEKDIYKEYPDQTNQDRKLIYSAVIDWIRHHPELFRKYLEGSSSDAE